MLIWSWAARNLCAWAGDLKRSTIFSRLRVSLCDSLQRLFNPFWALWSPSRQHLSCRCSVTSRFVGYYDTLGAEWANQPLEKPLCHLCISARLHQMSSTSPSASIACHSQYLIPLIDMTTSSKCHLSRGFGQSRRMQLANNVPNLLTQRRSASRLTVMPRSAKRSSTLDEAQSVLQRVGASNLKIMWRSEMIT